MWRWIGALAVVVVVAAVGLVSSGCCTERLLDRWLADSVADVEGELRVPGLQAPATISRDELGIPLVEAETLEDLAFATGWMMASDRLAQMVGFTMAAQGRLAEMAGEVALPMDIYARTIGLRAISEQQLAASSDEVQHLLQRFSAGVNAWLTAHEARLPLDFRLGSFRPEPWSAINSVDIFTMINLGLGVNLHEEIMVLNLAAKVGVDRLPWLVPIYPDEPLPFGEAAKLRDLPLTELALQAQAVTTARQGFEQMLMPQGLAASNNWVVAPSRSATGHSLLANDTHLLISQPPLWMLMHQKVPGLQVAGVALAGIPAPVLGFNGNVAWGATMVMADAQDLFLEQLKEEHGRWLYRAGDDWLPVAEREEVFRIAGGKAVTRVIRSTRHGPLLDGALDGPPISPVVPPRLDAGVTRYGLAFAWTAREPDTTMDAMFALGRSASLAEARTHIRGVRFIHLNMVMADKDAAGWQVTGRYPLRRAGTGQFPSPGWSGEYDWEGYADFDQHPQDFTLAQGYLGTANHRAVAPDYPLRLSQSWFYPQRGERIDELLAAQSRHSAADMVAMQADRYDRFVPALQQMLRSNAAPLGNAIEALPPRRADQAKQALAKLLAFDGVLDAESGAAALYGALFHFAARNIFLDELGPENTAAWESFTRISLLAYSAVQDHLLQQVGSPFWDDVRTPATETKWDILARSLSDAWDMNVAQQGDDPARWAWGALHTYHWKTAASEMRPWLPAFQRWALGLLSGYLDRGPYPAGGNHNTLNVAGAMLGRDFDVHSIPAMRMVVDFAAAEPLQLVNSGGQSGNPASPHYDDGIAVWRQWGNRTLPFSEAGRAAHYSQRLTLRPE